MKKTGVAVMRGAWEALAADPVALATTLLDMAAHTESDLVRVRVSRAILDRVGLRADVKVGLSAASLVHTEPSPPAQRAVDIVIERLAALRASKEQVASHARHIEEAVV